MAGKRLVASALVALAIAGSLGVQSCGGQQTTQTTVVSARSDPTDSDPNAPQPVTTTTTTTTTTSGGSGVIGETFSVVGTIILLPIKIAVDTIWFIL